MGEFLPDEADDKVESKSSVTVEELDKIVASLYDKEAEVDTKKAELAELNKQYAAIDAKIVTILKELGRDDYRSSKGLVKINRRWRISLPPTDAEKAALFDHLRERGIFDQYATVNANSLNSLYMADWDAAKKTGDGLTFSMPGIGPPKLHEYLTPYKQRSKKDDE